MEATQRADTVGGHETQQGIDLPAVEAWWAAHVSGRPTPLTFELIAGGRSNLTYRVTDATGRVSVLRRPPAGAVLQSAHDVLREARIVGALAASDVPVPEVLGVCAEPSVTGAPFYVMGHVDGVVLHDDVAMLDTYAESDRPRVAEHVIDGLARLHRVDVDATGLGDLGRREGYVVRQLDRWQRQWEASRTRRVPLIDELYERLSAMVPAQQRVSIVHGDYRLGNVILGPGAELRAVLDWELCTLGDPLADVGYTLAWWVDAEEAATHPLGRGPSSAAGVPGRDALLARYAAITGFDVSEIDFYVSFALWKTACIMEGVRVRDLRARPADAPPESQVPALAELALRALERS